MRTDPSFPQGPAAPGNTACALAGWQPYLPRHAPSLRGLMGPMPFVPMRHADGRLAMLYADTPQARALQARMKARWSGAETMLALAPRGRVLALWARLLAPSLTDFALNHLIRRHPAMSARRTITGAQVLALIVCLAVMAAWATRHPGSLPLALNLGFAAFFIAVAVGRVLAVVASPQRARRRRPRIPDAALPRYTVLVAMHDEVAVVPQLVKALAALDYPADRLEILLLIEEDDWPTRQALDAQRLPDHMAVLEVPPSAPRTKPKALNFALPLASGDIVAIYDAEDRPEPDQLRKVAGTYARHRLAQRREGGRPLGCVQAALHVTNGHEGFLARHFRLEYMALFDAFLPALAQFRLPIPLGGTSNHFSRRALMQAGGWDPYNVTEDADLGFRLARRGYVTRTVASTTFEDAPTRFGPWLRQRSRWFKGWWQTWLVHMRDPLALMRDLGPVGFLTVQTLMLGVLISMLLHPLFLAMTLYSLTALAAGGSAVGGMEGALLALNVANLVVGYAAAAALSWTGAERRSDGSVTLLLLQIPVYWLLLSIAGYLAVWDLIRRPHHWHKTPHEAASQPGPDVPDSLILAQRLREG